MRNTFQLRCLHAPNSCACANVQCRTAASELELPIWVSWTLDESEPKLRSGESIGTALEALHAAGLLSNPRMSALMFNCTNPEVITLALRYDKVTDARNDNG